MLPSRTALAWVLAIAGSIACEESGNAGRHDAGHDAASMMPATSKPSGDLGILLGPRLWHRTTIADAGSSDASNSTDAATKDPVLERGEYLVRHVAGCMECHTPRLPSGEFDEKRLLSGVENLADVEPDDPARGMLHSRNLTPDEKTGLGKFSDAQIKKAFQRGIDDESTVLHWMMPYWIYRNLHEDDADAIVRFLRSVPPVEHSVPDNEPTAVDVRKPYEPYELSLDALPNSKLTPGDEGYESAERGHYLATAATPCLLCHTPPGKDPATPIDTSLAFSGKRKFAPVRLGQEEAFDPTLSKIDSYNLTPHANGIGDWKPSDVANALIRGVGRMSLPVCDPMPSSYGGSFTGMKREDALDLGQYFTTIPPRDTGPIELCCAACHKQNGDDAGLADDAGSPAR
jgi:mono/diheme cytochrome c family protein